MRGVDDKAMAMAISVFGGFWCAGERWREKKLKWIIRRMMIRNLKDSALAPAGSSQVKFDFDNY